MKSGLRPYSFSVFIARRSGLRSRRDPQIGRREKELFHSDLMELAQTRRVCGDAELEVAQLALRRSLHLVSEMARITDVAPEAAAMAGRSVVEQALVGSYLALYRAPGGGVAGLLKRQRGYAGKLREHFLKGDMVGALALLPKVSFVAAPLSSDLGSVTGAPDLRNICSLLDEKEPFKSGNLATLIYYEAYAVLSNLVVHATPQALERHRRSATGSSRMRHRKIFEPATTFPKDTLKHAILPAIGGLCGSLARALDMPSDYYDVWLKEVNSIDGYEWSGSVARMAAVEGLTELVGLPSVYALNAAGFAVRALATADVMISSPPATQLIAACEILDRAKARQRWPKLQPFRLVSALLLLSRTHSSRDSDETTKITSGHAANHPQALLAALALVYAGLWPDDAEDLSTRLDAFDQAAPHESSALKRIQSQIGRKDMKHMRKKWKDQASKMP